MAFIGNTVQTVPFITDTFSGTGAQTAFTPLTRAPAGSASIAVFIAGVYQPPSAYTLSGVTITFVSAPTAGAGNIIVLHLGNGSATQVPSDGSVTVSKLSSDVYGYINAAFATANSDSGVANSGASYANSAFITANNSLGIDLTQNTNITNAGTYANSAFAAANTATASGSYANSAFIAANNSLGIDTTQNTNITNAGTYANAAFLVANTPTHVANSAASYANSGFAVANSAAGYANSAFAKANTAGVGTVTSVATGNGLSGGTITSTGTLVVACPTFNTVGSYCFGGWTNNCGGATLSSGSNYSAGSGFRQIRSVTIVRNDSQPSCSSSAGSVSSNNLSGTWKIMGAPASSTTNMGEVANMTLVCRVS